MKTPKGYRALTPNEVAKMSSDELSQLYSLCHRHGEYRCDSTGIIHFKIEEKTTQHSTTPIKYYIISWGTDSGDPHFSMRSLDDKIEDQGDGEWMYGLYIKT